jgi:predicted PurR-regulated permease PerM
MARVSALHFSLHPHDQAFPLTPFALWSERAILIQKQGTMPERETSERAGADSRFAKRVLLAVVVVLAAAGLVTLIWFSFNLWLVLFSGILFAIFLQGIGRFISRRLRIPHPWSLFVGLVLVFGLLTLAGWLLAKPVPEQFQELQKRLPEAVDRTRTQLQDFPPTRNLLQQLPSGAQIGAASSQITQKALGFFRGTFEGLAGLLLVFFLGLYLALSPDTYLDGFAALFPKRNRWRIKEVFGELGHTLQNWLLGQFLSMAVVGILIAIGLSIVGVPLSLVLGMIAGILDFIPIFGPILAAIPAVLLGFTHSPLHALYVVLVFVAANQIEGHLLIPLIQKHTVSLPPALTVFALTLLGTLFGFMGLLLATPLTATAMILVKRFYIEDVLGDKQEAADSD